MAKYMTKKAIFSGKTCELAVGVWEHKRRLAYFHPKMFDICTWPGYYVFFNDFCHEYVESYNVK